MQAAWTPVEVGELGELAGADVIVDPADLELDEASAAELEAAAPTVRRNVEHLRDYAQRKPTGKPRAIRLRFFSSPVAIHGESRSRRSSSCGTSSSDGERGATEERETIPCGIVFRSVGYQGVALPGLPFDESVGDDPERRRPRRAGLYVAGWIKRGPSGVIGTNKKDATETVALLLDDARAGLLPPATRARSRRCSRSVASRRCLYSGWEAIDAAERGAGEPLGARGSSLRAGTRCSRPRGPSNNPPFRGRQSGRSDRQLNRGFAQS